MSVEDRLIQLLKDSNKGPLRARDLARQLEIPRDELRDLLARLEKDGHIYKVRGNRYAAPDLINLVTGRLSVIRSGDGFVAPRDGVGDDVFVPLRRLESGMDGDLVVARIEGRPKGRNPEGRVLKILERAHPTLVGHFHRGKKLNTVRPLDLRMGAEVLIPPGDEGEALHGEVVVVRLVHFGDRHRSPLGEVERVLGPPDAPGVDVLSILHSHGLPLEFPPEVEAWVDREGPRLAREGGETRRDLRELEVFTIDPPDARDHDDALSVTPGQGNTREIGIHIADVSHFVPQGSPVDLEALERGTSVYLVDQVVPMLPHTLSSDLCSLKPGADRFAISLFVLMDDAGRVRSHRFARTFIRSRAHLTYQDVEDVLPMADQEDSSGKQVSGDALRLRDTLVELAALARVLRKKRTQRGSLDFDLPEARVVLDDRGAPVDIQRVVQLQSHSLVEEFMLLANELVAREALARKLPIPFRVHEPPVAQKMDQIRSTLASLGYQLPHGKVVARNLQSILSASQGKAHEKLVSTLLLRSLTRARYSDENVGHFGLASKAYAHFTSPIRRYPDLMVHRVLVEAVLEGRSIPESWGGETLKLAADQASRREQVAQAAERDSIALKKVEFMERHLGEEFEGTVSGVVAFGFFVLLDEVFVDGLVHVSSLDDDYYEFQETRFALRGVRKGRTIRLGDRVKVQVSRVDKEERKVDFLLQSV
ncbi:MAG: ribonuclease R [Gemmatimonadota bacterium]